MSNVYIVKYIKDSIKKTIVCNHIKLKAEDDIIQFIRKEYGEVDVYWRMLGN